jgi:hypothetical protein
LLIRPWIHSLPRKRRTVLTSPMSAPQSFRRVRVREDRSLRTVEICARGHSRSEQ